MDRLLLFYTIFRNHVLMILIAVIVSTEKDLEGLIETIFDLFFVVTVDSRLQSMYNDNRVFPFIKEGLCQLSLKIKSL
jgi:hypothetical protein